MKFTPGLYKIREKLKIGADYQYYYCWAITEKDYKRLEKRYGAENISYWPLNENQKALAEKRS